MQAPHSSIIDCVNQLTGVASIKDINSMFLACSPLLAQMLGYDNPEQVQGTTDFDMRCNAVSGAKLFVQQDQYALKFNKHDCINIYTYATGQKFISYCQKYPLIIDGIARSK